MNPSLSGSPAPEVQVNGEMAKLADAISALEVTRQSLLGRLEPVLRDEPAGLVKATDEPKMVPLADGIRTLRCRVEIITVALASALDRLEI